MPRVHFVKRARKKNPVADVGESYYWWKFRYGLKHYSKTPPRSSQLTQSPFLQGYYGIQDRLAELDGLDEETAYEIIDEIDSLSGECESSLYNMPEQFQDTSEAAGLLQERIEYLEEWADSIRNLDFDDPERALEEAIEADPGIS